MCSLISVRCHRIRSSIFIISLRSAYPYSLSSASFMHHACFCLQNSSTSYVHDDLLLHDYLYLRITLHIYSHYSACIRVHVSLFYSLRFRNAYTSLLDTMCEIRRSHKSFAISFGVLRQISPISTRTQEVQHQCSWYLLVDWVVQYNGAHSRIVQREQAPQMTLLLILVFQSLLQLL